MRISDWSSDVCSSDLQRLAVWEEVEPQGDVAVAPVAGGGDQPRLRKDGAPGGELALVVGVLVADPLDRAVLAGRGRRLPHRPQPIEEEILHANARRGLAEGPVDGLLAIAIPVGRGTRVAVAAQRRAENGTAVWGGRV